MDEFRREKCNLFVTAKQIDCAHARPDHVLTSKTAELAPETIGIAIFTSFFLSCAEIHKDSIGSIENESETVKVN